MRSNQITCHPDRIELFLQQKLSGEEQAVFESHLTECGDCCRRLESAAASEDIWREVKDSLGDHSRPDDLGVRDRALDSATNDETYSSQTTVRLLAPTDDDRMLIRWGAYEVVGVVGSGGMGVVLKAPDAALNRYVAIKILAPHLGSSGAARKRFFREGKAAAAVVHDNVIEIYGVAEAAGLPYLVMPYVRGPSLQRRLDDEGPLAVVEILRVGMQAAAGLAAAHAQGLVHRDVKPANILLADGIERVKLTDFGLARAADDASLTKTGIIAGTPQYMSPEQARGEPVDQRSDLFSLGSVLYAMCTGRPPFRAETSYGVLRRITDEEPRPIREINPDIPDWLCAVVAKLMAKRPDDRFQSAGEVAALLEQCLAHVQQPTIVPLPRYSPLFSGEGQGVRVASSHKPRRFAGWSDRKRIAAAAIGLLFFGGLGLALGILIHLKKDNKTTTVEVPEGSTARVDAQGAVTVELPPSPAPAAGTAEERAKSAEARSTIERLDVLDIRANCNLPDEAIDGYYCVEPDGNVALGPEYGRVQVRGLTLEAAEKAIEKKLQTVLIEPKVQVTIAQTNPPWHQAAPPRQPYTIAPFDLLQICVPDTPQEQPIDNYFPVEPEGTVPLGPEYGRVQLKGLTLEEAATAINKKLQAFLKEPNAWVTLPCHERPADAPLAPYTIKPNDLLYIMTAGAPREQLVEGIYAVEPSGTVPLGPLYGRVNVQGLSLEAAEKAIEKKLRKILTDPKVSVTVAGWADPAGAIGPGPIAGPGKNAPTEKAEAAPTALAGAVRAFNARHALLADDPIRLKVRPLLTEDEVVTAIRWALGPPRDAHMSDKTVGTLREIAENRLLPTGFVLEALRELRSNDRMEAMRWLVRLRIPDEAQHATYVNIRWRPLGSRLSGSEERKVVQKWRKEHPLDESARHDPHFEQELAKAREIDQSTAKSDSPPRSNEPVPENMTTLEEALRVFNAHAADDQVGRNQPPLTADEAIAAIRWFLLDPSKSPITDKTLAALDQVTRTRLLPPGFEFEVISNFQPNDEMEATIWSVRLRIPAKPDGWTTCVDVVWRPTTSRRFGEEERKVIEKWQKKRAVEGRSFSADDKACENERAKAREVDRAKEGKTRERHTGTPFGAHAPHAHAVPETKWMPENIKKDPAGYLSWAIEQTDATKTKLEAARRALTKQRRDLSDKLQKASADKSGYESFLKELEEAYTKADSKNDWPVAVRGHSFDKSELKRRIVECSEDLENATKLVETYSTALRKVADRLDENDRQRTKLETLGKKLATDLETAKVQETLEGTDNVGSDMKKESGAATRPK